MPSVHNTVSTELDAINTMLSVIGERPINSLADPLPADVAMAVTTLRETTREVQLKGWHFNSEQNFPLARNIKGEIPLPAAVFRVTLTDPDSKDVVQRGPRLYDRSNHTYIFTEDVEATIYALLAFDEMPEAFRWYVTVRSARKFQDRAVGSGDLHTFSGQDELDALVTAKQEDTETARPSTAKTEATTFISGWTPAMTLRR